MFKKNKPIVLVVVLVIIAVVLWWGWSSYSQTSQSATVVNSITPTNANYVQVSYDKDQINRIVTSLDTRMKTSMRDLENLGDNPSQAKIVSVANGFKNVSALMTLANAQLGPAMINANATGLSSALNDANAQLSNATSQIGVVLSNTESIGVNEKTADWLPLRQALIHLKLAQSYLQLSRSDISAIMKGLK